MYANLDTDKIRRIQDYRTMARYNVLADCLDEICDELLFEDEDKEYLKLELTKDYYSKIIEEEYRRNGISSSICLSSAKRDGNIGADSSLMVNYFLRMSFQKHTLNMESSVS